MPRANEQKIKLLVLYDILQRETDEEIYHTEVYAMKDGRIEHKGKVRRRCK